MRLLYIGDIMGDLGVDTVRKVLPQVKKDEKPDFVVAQVENVSSGKGITVSDFSTLKTLGIDFCTGGNWSLYLPDIYPSLKDPNQPIIRPANYPEGTAGLGYKYLDTPKGKVLIISLLGKIVGKDADLTMDNPLLIIDKILNKEAEVPKIAIVVNFHGDYSSEKVVIGHYLDGKVTAVIGDHWHVPTADARILPNSTAHITDVGMCGSLDSSLGVKLEPIYTRWRNSVQTRNDLETSGPTQFNAVLIDFDEKTNLATKIKQIRIVQD
ncbi:MAG TPA: TIGR00282 family metallophosphoesterase [Candidatus Saccharimonadales bacterium]